MKLSILTAVTRPENLEKIYGSIQAAETPGVEATWLVRPGEENDPGGQRTKNKMIDMLYDGWCYILDDDTLMHPDLLKRVKNYPTSDAVVVSQARPGGEIMHPKPALGAIDTGCVVFKRSLLMDQRIPEQYDGDGLFFEEILPGANVVYLRDVLATYNALR